MVSRLASCRIALSGYGLEIVERVPVELPAGEHNARYLKTKRDRMGHLLGGLTGHDRDALSSVLGEETPGG